MAKHAVQVRLCKKKLPLLSKEYESDYNFTILVYILRSRFDLVFFLSGGQPGGQLLGKKQYVRFYQKVLLMPGHFENI
jgi:hypothetical protein